MRLFVRIKLLRNLGLDDYLIVLAMVRTRDLNIGSICLQLTSKPDMCIRESGPFERSSSIGKRTTLQHTVDRAATECDQVHHRCLLPRYHVIRDPEARSRCAVDEAHESKPGT